MGRATRARARQHSRACGAGLHAQALAWADTLGLPGAVAVYGDKGYNAAPDEAAILADTGVCLVPIRRANMRPNDWEDKLVLRDYRKRIEALFSQLEAMGVQRLRARTNPGLELKLHAALLAATIANAN